MGPDVAGLVLPWSSMQFKESDHHPSPASSACGHLANGPCCFSTEPSNTLVCNLYCIPPSGQRARLGFYLSSPTNPAFCGCTTTLSDGTKLTLRYFISPRWHACLQLLSLKAQSRHAFLIISASRPTAQTASRTYNRRHHGIFYALCHN